MKRIRGIGSVEGITHWACAIALAGALATAGLPGLASAEAEAASVDDTQAATVDDTQAATVDDTEAATVGDTKADQRKTAIENIVVTSRKREETQQKVPVSVTAFTSTNLAEIAAADASAVADLTPNLMINRTASGSSAYVSCMRGLCRTDTTLTDDPYVGLYFNGVYTGKAMGSVFDVADIERIEVLRGPQGTLFGKNTIGGAVNMISAKPSGEAGAELQFLGGNYGTTNVKGVFELPEFCDFSMKISAMHREHDPFTKNLNPTGRHLGDQNRQAVLIDLLWEPADVFTADFTFDWGQQRERPDANFVTWAAPALITPNTAITDERLPVTYSWDEHSRNEVDSYGYSLTLNWDVGDLGPIHDSVLKSITGHRRFDNYYVVNSSGFDYRVLYNHDTFETQNTSQELQFNANTLDERLDILVGFFYLHEKGFYQNWQGYLADPAFGFVPGTFMDLTTDTWIRYNSYAFFTEEIWHITDYLRLSAGVRYTYEDRNGEHRYTSVNSDGLAGPGTGLGLLFEWNTLMSGETKFTSSTWSPRVMLSWDAAEDVMVFGGWSRGFKSGGFNARSIGPALWNPYDDQRVDSFELGFKSNFWDRRVQFNVTGFFQLDKDAQVQFNRITAAGWEVVLANAGDAHIYGAEFETVVRPVEGLELRLGLGITDSEYTEVINPWTGVDEKNLRHMEFSPKYNWNLSGRYIFPPLCFGTFYLRADYTGSSRIGFNTAIVDDMFVGQDTYGLLNLRFALTDVPVFDDSAGNLEFAFVANNLTDESYRVGGYGSAGFWYTNVYGDPRFLGGELTYRWGSQQ
jgi:iron complex outermembrane receptor protein